MRKKHYQKPYICEKFNVSEPVETGCCLRSCGGVPHHLHNNTVINNEIKQKFITAIKTRG